MKFLHKQIMSYYQSMHKGKLQQRSVEIIFFRIQMKSALSINVQGLYLHNASRPYSTVDLHTICVFIFYIPFDHK